MFIIRINLLTIKRYSKNVYKSFSEANKISVMECHQGISSQFCWMKNLSTNPQGENNKIKAKNYENSDIVQEEHPSTLSSDLDAITKGNKELEHKLKVLMLEAEVLRQDGKPVPSDEFMTAEIWENLLKLSSRSARTKYLGFLFKTAMKKESRLVKKLEKRKEYEEFLSQREEIPKDLSIEEHAMKYGLVHNNIFIRFHDTTINRFYNSRLIQAMQFGQKLVIDCGYDQNMTRRENHNTAKQLMLLFSDNRNNDEPFDIYYANMHKETDLHTMLYKYIPTMYDSDFPMNVHEKSYLDIFPRQKLVYLTPHCQEEMDNFDHDAVYIIGAIVDKINNEPLSLAKAKREGITMKKFPLDRYLQWGSGSGKSLTINQCVAILLDVKATGDWNYALRHVPRRKLADTTSFVNNSKSASSTKPFYPQKKIMWKPDSTNKKSKINIRHFYD